MNLIRSGVSVRWWRRLFGPSDSAQKDSAKARHRAATVPAEEALADWQTGDSPVVLDVSDVLDLHPFAPHDVAEVVEAYLEEARKKGFPVVRIVHGKGIGVQRDRVRSVLSRTPFVARFGDAPMGAGGWGATVVWFKKESG